MDVDSYMLGKYTGILPVGYQNIKKRICRWGIVEGSGSTNDIQWKILDACCAIEKLTTM